MTCTSSVSSTRSGCKCSRRALRSPWCVPCTILDSCWLQSCNMCFLLVAKPLTCRSARDSGGHCRGRSGNCSSGSIGIHVEAACPSRVPGGHVLLPPPRQVRACALWRCGVVFMMGMWFTAEPGACCSEAPPCCVLAGWHAPLT